MNVLVMNVFLALVWSALVGGFSLMNMVVGFVLGYLTLYLLRGVLGPTNYFTKGLQIVYFFLYFLWELFVANLRVARDVLRPGPLRMKPRVIAVPLDHCNDLSVTLLANVLSLTPGSLSLDVSTDPCVLFVHSINAPDADETRAQIKNGFERLVMDLFKGVDSPAAEKKELVK